jgi:hypothetical protein
MNDHMTALDLFCAINLLTQDVRDVSYLHVKCIRQTARIEFLVQDSELSGSKFYPSTLAFGELSDGLLSHKAYQYSDATSRPVLYNPSTAEYLGGIKCRKLSEVHEYLASMTLIEASNTRLCVYETNKMHQPMMFKDKDMLIFGVNMFYTIARQPDDLSKDV